ncbi:hypothetical protein LPJ75_001312 [Coemansia sp. RSA 2598]|nr:hypothetical protein LPJ75_001312 [Coemansia sp. RSA 2598]
MAMSASSPAPMTSATRVVSQDPSNGDRARDSVVGKLRIKPFRGKKFEKFFTAFEEAADAAKWMDDRKMLKFHEYLRNEALYVWKGIIQDLSEPGKRIRWMDATKMYREVYMTDTDKEEKRQRERALNSFIEKTNKNKKERNDAKNATKVMLLAAGMGLSEKRLVRVMMKVISKESVRRLENARPAPNTPREVLELIKKLAPKPTDIQKVIRSSYRKKAAEATDSSDSESSSDESASDTESDMSTDKGFALDYTDSTDESSEGEAELVSRARKARRVVEKTRAKPKEEKREEKKSEVDVLTEQISQLVLLVQRQEIEKQKAAAEKKEVANTYKGCFYCDQKDHAMKYCPMLREDERKGIVVQKDGLVCMASGELVPRATSVTGPMRNYVLRQMRESVIKPVEESRMPRSVNFIRADRVKSPIDIASDDNYDSEAEVLYAEELQGEYEVDMAEKRRRAVGDDANRVSGIPEVQDTRPQRVVRPRTQEPMAPSVNSVPSTPALTSPVTRAATWGRQSEPQDAIMRGTLRGPPAFRYVAPVEKAGADERTMDLLMQTTVAIPIADLLSVSQSIRSLMQKQVTRVKVSNPASSASTANWIEGEVLGSYVEMPMSADVMNETRIIGYPPYATKSVQVEVAMISYL